MARELSGKIKGGINEFEKLFEKLLLWDQRVLVLVESERSARFRLMKARRYEVFMRGTVRMLPTGPLRPFSLLHSIRTGAIEPFGRGCGFSATRNETLHSSHDNSGY